MKSFFILISSLIFINMGFTQSFSDHLWQNRVILLFANENDAPLLSKQLELLTSYSEEVTNRDLVVHQVFQLDGRGPRGEMIDGQKVNVLRTDYGIEYEMPFQFILIGKDGGVKLRSAEVVSMKALFALIDGMPMRKAEMKRQKQKKSSKDSQH